MDGRDMKTLQHKTYRYFCLCMVSVFLISAPLFYLITKQFYAEDMIDIIESVQRGDGIPALDLEQDIIIGMMIQLLLVFWGIGLSLFLTVRFVTRNLWAPFDDTLMKTEQFNLSQGELPVFVNTEIAEFQRLNRSLMKLMEKDSKAFRIQKEFSENASHELQTPLALLRGKLDLLMQEGLNEQQMRIVGDLYQIVTRMTRLNSNLLLLAKIDNAQYAATEEVDIARLLDALLTLYKEIHPTSSVEVKDKRTKQHQTMQANTSLTESLLKNLIVNAVRHSAPGSTIHICLYDDCMSVSNPSSDHQPLDDSLLFRRFHHSAFQQEGNGLGLAIVKAVCDFHR